MFKEFNLNKAYQLLLIALAFLMPLTVFGANLIIIIICFTWLFSRDYQTKYNKIISSPLLISSIIFFALHVVGLLWTEDIIWGLEIVHKMWYFFLLLPILFTIVESKYIKYYINAFLLAIFLTEVLSYLVWFEIIPIFKNASISNPTPFMSHISYNPILVIAIYLVAHKVFIEKNLSKLNFFYSSFFLFSMTFNMFITGGRAGQVMFFAMVAILIFQVFSNQKIKALFLVFTVIPLIFFIAYTYSDIFSYRIDLAIKNFLNFSIEKSSSVSERIVFAMNSWEIIQNHLLIGVGTGDFPEEYKKVNEANTPLFSNATNPHNMYSLILVQLGLVGLISMLTIFYYQINLSFLESNQFYKNFGIALPFLFLIIMMSDSYLLGHYTTLVYVFFSSFLYQKFE